MIERIATYNEIKYSIPVLAGAVLVLADVETEADFVEVIVASVVDNFNEVVEVLVDDTVVALGFDVSTPGIHWPEVVSI